MTSFGVPIFGTRVYLTMGRAEAEDWRDKHGFEDSMGGVDGVCCTDRGDLMIYIKTPDMALLAHECLHAATATLEYIGDESRDEEVMANLMQHIMAECIKRLDKCSD